MNMVNVGYSSTNYYVLEEGDTRLLIDVGMPGTFGQLLANMKRAGISLPSIRYLLVTHYHPDHAGIVEEVKAAGVRLIVMEPQVGASDLMHKMYIKPDSPFIPIRLDNNVDLTLGESRAFLKKLGIEGEIIATPGHSDDSVSLVLDDGSAFIGDLTPPTLADDENRDAITASWAKLASLQVKRVYAGHGPSTSMPQGE
jgi:glyoxylase-like metal-dependent hydrolase (beta-lactamase superfamily II)